MRIVGKGKNVYDADLMVRLALDSGKNSGNTISKKEAEAAVKQAVHDLKDEFIYSDSTRGLTRAARAITNTLNRAIKDGWVRPGKARDIILEFLNGTDEGSLKESIGDIKYEVAQNRNPTTSYGGYSGSVSYGGYSSGT